MLEKNYFAARLTEARKAAGLTKRALAAQVGLSERAIGQLEQGRYFPTLPVATAIAKALGISLDWLVGLSADPHPAKEGGE